MDIVLRSLRAEDEPFLWQMLMLAAHESSLASVQAQTDLVIYGTGWGRPGDMGVVAVWEQRPVGAAWLRLWGDHKGYGYVDDGIPELAIAVLPDFQGRGVGTRLLAGLIAGAQGHFPAISLSARLDNPAVDLYRRLGFVEVEGTEVMNRTGGCSVTMVYEFSD